MADRLKICLVLALVFLIATEVVFVYQNPIRADKSAEKALTIATSSSENAEQVFGKRSVDYTSSVEELLQYPELPSGCEPVSLTIVLRSMGFDLSLTEIVDQYLDYDGETASQFFGDPYDLGGAFPPALINAADAYLEAKESSSRAYDLTGSDFESLVACVQTGYPIMVWTTMYLEDPYFTDEYIDDYAWYDNEHCVVFYGIENDQVLISDPLEGLVKHNYEIFKEIYNECGKMAVIIL